MAEENDLERNEPASQKRLEQAREEGQVPRSRELASFAVLLSGALTLSGVGDRLAMSLQRLMRDALSFDHAQIASTASMLERLGSLSFDALLAIAPLLVVLVLAALLAPLLVQGWMFSLDPLQPNFSRLNLWAGLQRMFALSGAIELGKALLKVVLISAVACWAIWRERGALLPLSSAPLPDAIAHLGHELVVSLTIIVAALAILAAIDVPLEIWRYRRGLRMTRDEVRREAREADGDPQLKARIKGQQREMARRRMMSEIPKADVVVTNPTHFAVALAYRDGTMRAPRVVAKGAHLLAARIRQIADEHRIPIVEAPPLARALYRHSDLGEEVPRALYSAVAEVLAYVYQLRRAGASSGPAPTPLGNIEVPPELDPGSDPA